MDIIRQRAFESYDECKNYHTDIGGGYYQVSWVLRYFNKQESTVGDWQELFIYVSHYSI